MNAGWSIGRSTQAYDGDMVCTEALVDVMGAAARGLS